MRSEALNSAGPLQSSSAKYHGGHTQSNLGVWLDALRALPASGATEADVLAWVEGPLRRFLPFERFWLAYGDVSGGRVQMRSMLSSGHLPEFVCGRPRTFELRARGCFEWWVANRKPFVMDLTGARNEAGTNVFPTKVDFEEIERYSFGTIAANGMIDPFVNAGTYISFAGVPSTRSAELFSALNLIAPVLHALYLQTKQARTEAVDLTALTDRQRDLAELALEGLSDKAIAARLAISEHTVGNHFRAIYARLGVTKRSQLITLLK